ncbi:MAG: caspase family protein [Candidatus Obscuribacterales bacterium]|jgi:hypothetical protein|nr:caspase family protein [Candidatus Obscuribacterales bacterium]
MLKAVFGFALSLSLLLASSTNCLGETPLNAQAQQTTYQAQTGPPLTQNSWDPAHTWVFMVCILNWPKKAGLDNFDTESRKDLVLKNTLVKLGVPADHIVYLADKNATLKSIDDQLSKLLANTKAGDFLLTYYCGHGWTSDGDAFFGNYDADDNDNHCWRVSSFAQKVAREFQGKNALLTADCCHSGALGEEMSRLKTPFNYATCSSSTSAISSTENWTFSQGIIDCLQGHRYADFDNNRIISFTELTKYLQSEMQSIEKQNSAASRSPSFDPDFTIARVLYPNETIPELVEVLWDGDWFPAKVMEKNQGKSRVRWLSIGWDAPESDEWVTSKNIRPLRREALKLPKASAQQWQVGSRIKVESEGQFYPAKILKYRNGSYFIHYDDYDSSDDEWVDPEQIRSLP